MSVSRGHRPHRPRLKNVLRAFDISQAVLNILVLLTQPLLKVKRLQCLSPLLGVSMEGRRARREPADCGRSDSV